MNPKGSPVLGTLNLKLEWRRQPVLPLFCDLKLMVQIAQSDCEKYLKYLWYLFELDDLFFFEVAWDYFLPDLDLFHLRGSQRFLHSLG
jgi:hypothetical protein